FTEAYAASPVCSPTRASILTGKYPPVVGITNYIGALEERGKLISAPFLDHLPLEEKTIASVLKENGYRTFHVGKWHLGDEPFWPEHHGFEVNVAGCHWGHPKHGYFSPYHNPRLADGSDGEYLTDRLTGEAIKLIESVPPDEPFFLFMSYYSVHVPIQAPKHLIEKYKEKARIMGLDKINPFEIGEKFPCEHKRGKRVKRRVIQSDPAYAAMIENLDANVGRLLSTLQRLGKEDNTIVIFFSDNGGLSTAEGSPTCNFPLREGKGWMQEGGIRDPLIIRLPGVTMPGMLSETPVISVDFFPTILETIGISGANINGVDGMSIFALLRGEEILDRRPLFWHFPHYGNQGGIPTSAIRKDNFKLIKYHDDGHVELHDLKADIGEHVDLSSRYPSIATEMISLLDEWLEKVKARMPERNPEWPLSMSDKFIRIIGKLQLDNQGNPCIKAPLTRQNPALFLIPLQDILEDYLDKEIILDIRGNATRCVLSVDDAGHLLINDLESGSHNENFIDLIQPAIGQQVKLIAGDNSYILDERILEANKSQKNVYKELERKIMIYLHEDPEI
ncbi:MAG: sulfatase, partial [Promethearchaeota archaeon]